jgi:hypothetical protein
MSREAAHGGCQKGAAGGLESFVKVGRTPAQPLSCSCSTRKLCSSARSCASWASGDHIDEKDGTSVHGVKRVESTFRQD